MDQFSEDVEGGLDALEEGKVLLLLDVLELMHFERVNRFPRQLEEEEEK